MSQYNSLYHCQRWHSTTLRLFNFAKHTLIRSYMLEIQVKIKSWALLERSLVIICKAKIKNMHSCSYATKCSTFSHGCFKNTYFCRSIDLLWLNRDVCLVLKACCDLIRLLKNKGQETPSQHKGWNKNPHLHIQPLFFPCLWAKLAIRGSEAKVINSTVLYKLT